MRLRSKLAQELGFTELVSGNAKLSKTNPLGIPVFGLVFAPHKSSGRNVCPYAGACVDACVIGHSGRTVMSSAKRAAVNRTLLYFQRRELFRELLSDSLKRLVREHGELGFRPNVGSDLPWERLEPWMFSDFPSVHYYDYTKWPIGKRRELPTNYQLSYSVSEKTPPGLIGETLAQGRNVVIGFHVPYYPQLKRYGELPELIRLGETGSYYRVIDGDKHDLRLSQVDGSSVVIGLRAKGNAVTQGAQAGFFRAFPGSRIRSELVKRGIAIVNP